MLILALDPGIKNYGYALLDCSNYRVIASGLLKYPIYQLNEPSIKSYRSELIDLLNHKPNIIIVERFQYRQALRGAQVEKINIMIGILLDLLVERNIDFMFTTPNVWKRYTNPRMLYKYYTSHVIDSVLMALWTYTKLSNKRINIIAL